MGRTVFCRKHQQSLEGLDAPPFPGPKGEDIFANVSRKAWDEWLAQQTMLINEKRLNLTDMTTRAYLAEQRDRFLAGASHDRADGFVPPTK
jgi:Fe-S cluster biosynthesis and repair protein YggX